MNERSQRCGAGDKQSIDGRLNIILRRASVCASNLNTIFFFFFEGAC